MLVSRRNGLLMAVLFPVFVASCSGNTATTTTGEDITTGEEISAAPAVRIVVAEEPSTLDAGNGGLADWQVNRNIVEALVDLDADTGEVLPLLAESWEQVDDLTWEFSLREGVTFHNGEPFNAEAVVVAVNRLYGPGEMLLAAQGLPEFTAEAVDEMTVAISTADPDPIVPREMFFIPIMEPGATGDSRNVRDPVGTGPYQFVEWSTSEITLEAYDDYWQGAPEVAVMEYQWRSESPVRAQMVENGEADIAAGIAAQDFGGNRIETVAIAETVIFRYDVNCPLFTDIRVREAINQAIDRQLVAETVFEGLAEPAGQMVPPSVVGFSPNLQPPPYDVDGAATTIEAVAAEAGWENRDVQLIYRPDFFLGAQESSEVFADSLRQLGFDVTLEGLDASGWVDAIILKPIPPERCAIIQSSAGSELRDVARTFSAYLSTDGNISPGSDPTFDSTFEEASAVGDDTRGDRLAEVGEYQADSMVWIIPVVHLQKAYALGEGVEWTPRPDGLILGSEMG